MAKQTVKGKSTAPKKQGGTQAKKPFVAKSEDQTFHEVPDEKESFGSILDQQVKQHLSKIHQCLDQK